MYQELINDQRPQTLLHGDLHHYNILRHQHQWFAIDPKGVMSEKEFEFSAFMRNWSFVQAILAAYWAYEDKLPIWQKFLSCATFLTVYV